MFNLQTQHHQARTPWRFSDGETPTNQGEERNHRERLERIQGEFLNPVVALRMRAKHSPYRWDDWAVEVEVEWLKNRSQ